MWCDDCVREPTCRILSELSAGRAAEECAFDLDGQPGCAAFTARTGPGHAVDPTSDADPQGLSPTG
jgi:hypothetical protein